MFDHAFTFDMPEGILLKLCIQKWIDFLQNYQGY